MDTLAYGLSTRLLVSLGAHGNTCLLTYRGSNISSSGASLFSLDSENRVSKRVDSALNDIQWT